MPPDLVVKDYVGHQDLVPRPGPTAPSEPANFTQICVLHDDAESGGVTPIVPVFEGQEAGS